MTQPMTSESSPIRVDFVSASVTRLPGRIGMTIAPGKKTTGVAGVWDRNVETDLERLVSIYRAGLLVSLVTRGELERFGIADLYQVAADVPLKVLKLPMPDGGVPSKIDDVVDAVGRLLDRAAAGTNVVIHCRGGQGRSGLVAACALVALGLAPAEAIREVRAARRGAVETTAQERFVERFASAWPGPSRAVTTALENLDAQPGVDRFRGCLLGGALGDALGYPVEFVTSSSKILSLYGADPPRKLAYARDALITDDTQMTLFTAEGVLRGIQRHPDRGVSDMLGSIQRALHRWLRTQEPVSTPPICPDPGWLIGVEALHERRAPGNTNLSSLRAQASKWHLPTVDSPTNDSKGCGAIMRSAPIGLAAGNRETAFELARDGAAVTHGHPSGYLASAYFAALVYDVARGEPLREAMCAADELLARERGREETVAAVESALAVTERGVPDATAIQTLGGGWIAEEALAIALAVVLTADARTPAGVAAALWRAAAHAGDSDSTASVAGNLLGAMHGEGVLPKKWLEELELRDVIGRIADDLWASSVLGSELDWEAYPPD